MVSRFQDNASAAAARAKDKLVERGEKLEVMFFNLLTKLGSERISSSTHIYT